MIGIAVILGLGHARAEPLLDLPPAIVKTISARLCQLDKIGPTVGKYDKATFPALWITGITNSTHHEIAELTIRFFVKDGAGKVIYKSDHVVRSFTDVVYGFKGSLLPYSHSKLMQFRVDYPALKFGGQGYRNSMGILSAKTYAKPDLRVPTHLFSYMRVTDENSVVK